MSIAYRDDLEKFLTDKANEVFEGQVIKVDVWERVPYTGFLGIDFTVRPYWAKYWWEAGKGEITFMFPSQEVMEKVPRKPLLAVLAHELGHAEQRLVIRRGRLLPPPIESDAWRRGIKSASRLDVMGYYISLFFELLPANPMEDLRRVMTQFEELRQALGGG